MSRYCLLLAFLCMAERSVHAQANPYAAVDSIMRACKLKIKSQDELYKLTYFIRTHFTEDSLRFRASFIWITENIAYDVKAYEEGDTKAGQLDYVILNKRAVCGGYAALLKYLCDAFSIPCEIIEGYGRARKQDLVMRQSKLVTNHAWNAVKINGTWRQADATWAAGGVDENTMKFYKRYEEIYYFTPPERLVYNHFPTKFGYQYTSQSRTDKEFTRSPLFCTDFLKTDITAVFPDSALVRTKTGDTIEFRFKTTTRFKSLLVFSPLKEKTDQTLVPVYENDWMKIRYIVKVPGTYELFIGGVKPDISWLTLMCYKLDAR